jgi:TIR domain
MLRRLQQLLDHAGLGSRSRCRIFISYRRRGEGAGYAGRLADRLIREFGDEQCFRDVDDIESGTDFVEAISNAVGACQVLVVVVAPDWLNATDANGRRRLDNPQDFVRIEIAAALDRNTRVVPVLVGGALMPAPEDLPAAIEGFARRQAHELSDSRWDYDVDQLVAAIERIGVKRVTKRRQQPAGWVWKVPAAIAATGVAVWAAIAFALNQDQTRQIEQTIATLAAAQTSAAAAATIQSADVPLTAGPAAKGAASSEPDPKAAQTRQTPAYDPEPRTRYDAVAAERPLILDAMRRANDAERHALHYLDASVLDGAFTGGALQAERAAVQELMSAGVHTVNTLHAQRIEGIELSDDGAVAWVEAVETWSSEYHQNGTDICLARTPAHEVPQTVQLVRGRGAWIVAAVEIRAAGLEPVPCG